MFPLIWKPAIIVLVHKNGLSTCTANYRPISLTCVTSKIMERVITGQLLSYFVENRLINEAQHDFLKDCLPPPIYCTVLMIGLYHYRIDMVLPLYTSTLLKRLILFRTRNCFIVLNVMVLVVSYFCGYVTF